MEKNKLPRTQEPDNFDKFNACSAWECTGLITVPPESDEERESYKDIYSYEIELDD